MIQATITTDAAFSRLNNVGTFGVIIECDEFVLKRSGVLKGVTLDSNDAEIKAIGNAVFMFLNSKIVCDELTIYTDSKVAIEKITYCYYKLKRNKYYKFKSKYPGINKICRLLLLSKLINGTKEVKFAHVRSHVYIESRNHNNNDICDKMAKDELKKVVSKIIASKNESS